MVRRGPAIRYRLAQRDDARDRDEKGASFSARRAAEGFDALGFVFYTHYRSRKGRELEENPQAMLLFC